MHAGRRAVELDQPAKPRRPLGEVVGVDGRLADEGQADIGLLQVHGLGGDELRVKPGGLGPIDRGRFISVQDPAS
jgi:hypothetical protein